MGEIDEPFLTTADRAGIVTLDFLRSSEETNRGWHEVEHSGPNLLTIFLDESIDIPPAYHDNLLRTLGDSGLSEVKVAYIHSDAPQLLA